MGALRRRPGPEGVDAASVGSGGGGQRDLRGRGRRRRREVALGRRDGGDLRAATSRTGDPGGSVEDGGPRARASVGSEENG